jgi:uncharacterized membrane protein
MQSPIVKIFILFLIFISIDFIYLGIVRKDFIADFFNYTNGSPLKLKWIPAILSWILLAWGLYYFVVSRAGWTLQDAALLGLLVYGVYDMTNLATLKTWTLNFAVQDMIWGAAIMVLVSKIYSLLVKN